MNSTCKIVLTGAESTGKSTLAKGLAEHFHSSWIPEFARTYVENLSHKYTYADVEIIARKQLEIESDFNSTTPYLFFDTWLIITKVWFDFVFKKHPQWLHEAIKKSNIDLFLVCNTDLAWIDDPVRENGGENRELLHSIYIEELKNYGFNYKIVSGDQEERLKNAIDYVNQL